MGVTSGVTGAVNGYSTVRKWMIEDTIEESELLTLSNTSAGQVSEGGVTDWKGYFIGKGHTPGVFPGDALSFSGDIGNGTGKSGTAICEVLDITGDVERNHAIEYNVRFSGNGVLASHTTPVTDSTACAFYLPTSLAVYFGSTKLTDTRYWRLILKNATRPYVSSETAAGRKRNRGAMTGGFIVKSYFDDPTTLPTVGSYYTTKFYVTDTTFWQVGYCRVMKVEDLGADHDSEENVGVTISGVFSAWNNGTALGSIIDPAVATKWPFAA
jgi:hypothetical protein